MQVDDVDNGEGAEPTRHGLSVRRIGIELGVGAMIGLALLLAIIASTGEIPFVYQGY